MKKSNPFAHFFLLLVILIPYALMLLHLDSKIVESATNEQVLVDKESLKVTSSYQIDTLKKTIDWSLTYESQAEAETSQLLKVKFSEDQVFEDHSSNWEKDSDGWWVQETFSNASQGVIRFSTALSESQIFISLQLAKKEVAVDGKELLEEAVLTDTEEGPHELIAEVPTQESSTQPSSFSNEASSESEAESTFEQSSTTPSSNESSSTNKEKTATSTEAFIGPLRSQKAQEVPESRGAIGDDPFAYTTNGEVKYPTHGTQSFLGGGATEDPFIKNYHYGVDTTSDDVAQYLVTNSDLTNIEKGYHEYGNTSKGQINTKKTVKCIGTQADGAKIYEVTVDTIGDAIQPQPAVDIVLVLDKSGSMKNLTSSGKTRWGDLQQAVGEFLDGIHQSNMNVRFALASFFSSSISSATKGTHDAHMAVWTNHQPAPATPNDYFETDYFTSDHNKVKNKILAENAYENTGTPTFMGIESALYMLSKVNRESTKVICTISDGLPTVYPIPTYYQGSTLNQSLNKLYFSRQGTSGIFDNRFLTQQGISGYELQALGDGINETIGNNQTMPYLETRLEEFGSAYKWYSVGYHTNGDTYNSIIETLGQDGVFSVNNSAGLVDALSQAVYPYISTIGNATLIDPMSKFVTLNQSSVELTPISIDQNGVLSANPGGNGMGITKKISSDSIQLENVNLGKTGTTRNGVRLTYQVTLKPEYRNGNFYPANEATYLLNGNGEEYFYAVPSIRDGQLPAETVDVELTKIIKGTTTGLANAKFGLFASETGGSAQYESTVSESSGKIKFSEVEPGTYWLREIETPPGYQEFTPIQVTIDAEGGVTGLSTFPNVENEWKPIVLEIFKKNETGEKALPGATFGLFDVNPEDSEAEPIQEGTSDQANGAIAFTTQLLPGTTYYLKELVAPEGYLKQSGIYRIEVGRDGSLTITYDGTEIAQDDMDYIISVESEKHQLNLMVRNSPITPLPRTGGIGRLISYFLFVMLLSGMILYYLRSRQDTSQRGGV